MFLDLTLPLLSQELQGFDAMLPNSFLKGALVLLRQSVLDTSLTSLGHSHLKLISSTVLAPKNKSKGTFALLSISFIIGKWEKSSHVSLLLGSVFQPLRA